jgi:hypothetical protein
MSPIGGFYFFLILTKWSKYTCKSPSNKCLFLHKAPSVKSTLLHPYYFIKKMLLKNIKLAITMVIFMYVYNCLFRFSTLVTVGSEMPFGTIHLETWGNTQPYVACSCFFVFGRTHTAPIFLTLHDPVYFVF